jgi:hypothetical protein
MGDMLKMLCLDMLINRTPDYKKQNDIQSSTYNYNRTAYIESVQITKIITYHFPHIVTTWLPFQIFDVPWTVHP